MNRTQKRITFVGFALLGLIILTPPYHVGGTTEFYWIEWAPLFLPPNWKGMEVSIVPSILAYEISILAIITATLVYWFKPKD